LAELLLLACPLQSVPFFVRDFFSFTTKETKKTKKNLENPEIL